MRTRRCSFGRSGSFTATRIKPTDRNAGIDGNPEHTTWKGSAVNHIRPMAISGPRSASMVSSDWRRPKLAPRRCGGRCRQRADHRDVGDKQQRGRVLIVAGSVEIPGTAPLASLARCERDWILQVTTCRSSAAHLRIAMPEALVVGCEETANGGIHLSAATRLAGSVRGPIFVQAEIVCRKKCQ